MRVDLGHLEVLLTVVDEGSFDGAAATLRVSPSAVSQRIKALEHQAGQVLLRRTKPVSATDAAVPYLQAARQIRAVVEQTIHYVPHEQNTLPTIPLAANSDSLETWLIPALGSVKDVARFQLFRDDQDHTADLLRAGTVMAGITSTQEPVQGCESHRLGIMRYLPISSIDFAKEWFKQGIVEHSFAHAPVLLFDRKDSLQNAYLRNLDFPHLTPPRNYIPSNGAFLEAIKQDLGWGMIPEVQVVDSLESGELMHLGGHIDVTLYWQQWKLSSEPLDALRQAVSEAAAYSLRIA
ncbi:LysR family transcriptional regulator ArgP [Timonella sp. A28]|uniref:LysR family transcriptional regulator ArgP n=1 Tax=Timonella sp. A28 TaxID=3442640 RepID=UPI003EC04B66